MIGETIGNFRIVSRLGRGGMGEVYAAEQTSIGTKVAVKVLHAQISDDAEHVRRFFNEARAVQKIQHAGIVKVFDVGTLPSGNAYLVMEYLEGESLAARIKRLGKLHPGEVADLGRQIASVLSATHTAGITHRDLKPDNVFLVADKELATGVRAKILDFGIAKMSGTLAGDSPQTIGTMGTPAYMAPEQWGDASKVDWRADLYSLGCVAFEMACGRPPFVVSTIGEACGKHMGEAPPRAKTIVANLDATLDHLIDALLAKRPEDRPQPAILVAQRFEVIGKKIGPAPSVPLVTAPEVHAAVATGTPVHPRVNALAETMASGDGNTALAMPSRERETAIARPVRRPRKRRGPLAVGALVLVGGGAAVAVMMMKRGDATAPAAAPGSNEPFCTNTAPPVLDGASTGPVELTYAFVVGQQTEVTAIAHGTQDVVRPAGRERDEVTVTLEGTVTWTAADPGKRFAGTFDITRTSVDYESVRAPAAGHEAHDSGHWKSDEPVDNTPKQLQITFAIGPHGELLDSNLNQLQDALAHHHGGSGPRSIVLRDDLFRSMFPRLPDHPVSVGDTWRAGELVRPLPSNGHISAKLDLRVQQISKDGKQVLLSTDPVMHVDLAGSVALPSQRTAVHGWAQLDLARHEISASALHACAILGLDVNGTRSDVTIEHVESYDTRPLGVKVVEAPPPPPPIDAGVEPPPDAAPVAPAPATGIAKAIEDRIGGLRACGSGSGTMRLTIGSNGRVQRASVQGFDAKTRACVSGVIRGISIARPRGGPAFTVTVPLAL